MAKTMGAIDQTKKLRNEGANDLIIENYENKVDEKIIEN